MSAAFNLFEACSANRISCSTTGGSRLLPDQTPSLLYSSIMPSTPNAMGTQQMMFNSMEFPIKPHSPEPELKHNVSYYAQPTETDNAGSWDSNNLFGDLPADAFEPVPIGGRATKTSGPSVLDVSVLDGALELALSTVSKTVSKVRKASKKPPITASAPMVKRRRISSSDQQPRFRWYQEQQWEEQFEELLKFKEEQGHCLVPHTYPKNQALARWVKRQRYQYKLKAAGKAPSTMTDDRIKKLEDVGFVWNTHALTWDKRLKELVEYCKKHGGDCNVPSNYPENPELATWIKCQRRQFKLFSKGAKESSMTLERINALNELGFSWKVREDLPSVECPIQGSWIS
ncbi:unnamed protein product [Cylindrotheca closterium]|uniref:Helicase-associated domain-containing protein n=1 Tax=Cylindrotheca closterium TaxID=2856 RepID=A0AAD2FGH2_9STRA|nr:unnamed protein product [Cylindrotheca closterium]